VLFGASAIVGLLSDYRLCWISGRFSGGKTSLAYRLAYDFLKQGYRLVSTNASVWDDPMDQVKLISGKRGNPVLRCVVILDEGGLYFKSSKQIEQVAAFAAKMDVVYLIPSFFPPVRAAQVVNLQPVFSFRAAGIPLIVYRWSVHVGGFRDQGSFFWWRPQEIYGIYSRQDPGAEPEDVIDWLVMRMEEFQEHYGRGRGKRKRVRAVGESGRDDEDAGFADIIADAAATMAEAADRNVAAASLSRGRRRRR